MWSRFGVLSILFLLVCPARAVAAPQGKGVLPLTRIRIYETGIAYFEREGVVPKDDTVSLPLPAGHLDDALKTLVLLDPDKKARLTGVTFQSAVSRERARALARVQSDSSAPLDFEDLIESMRGYDVWLDVGGRRLSGQVVDVVPAEHSSLKRCVPRDPAKPSACVVESQAAVTIATEEGALERFLVSEVQSIKPVDRGRRDVLTSALKTLSGSSAAATRTLTLEGQAGSRVALGYLGEAPLWRASYRLLLQGDEPATLQGWALLHNDSNEAWRGVRVELVNGRPDSFLFPLAAPRYGERRLVAPQRELSTVPQLFSRGADDMWAGDYGEIGGLGLSGIGVGGGGSGMGMGFGTIAVPNAAETTDLLSVGNLAESRPTTAVEKGALFLYSIEAPLALEPNHSSLVPFLTRPLKTERFVLFQRAGDVGRSVLAVENTASTTLPTGPAAVFDEGGLAGESVLRRLKPGQRQLLSFGADLDLEIEEVERTKSEHVRKVGFSQGQLDVHYIKRQKVTLRIENLSGHDKRALLALELVNNAKVSGAELHYDEATHTAYAKLNAPQGASRELTLTLEEGLRRRIALEDLSIWRLELYGKSPALTPEAKKSLLRAARALDESYERFFRLARLRAGLEMLEKESRRLQRTIRFARATSKTDTAQLMQRLLSTERRIDATTVAIRELRGTDRWASVRDELGRLPEIR